jgi:hypothetical protein
MLMAVETGQLHKFKGMPLDSIDDTGIHLFLFFIIICCQFGSISSFIASDGQF